MIKLYDKNSYEIPVKWWTFPGGERSCKLLGNTISSGDIVLVEVNYRSSDDMVDMLSIVNALRYAVPDVSICAKIPYFPGARQDRVMTGGEPFSLQVFVQMVKLCNFKYIEIDDPHSDVLSGMFDPGQLIINSQHDIFYDHVIGYMLAGHRGNMYLVSPDAGALKKIHKLSQATAIPVIESVKVRDVATGNIISTRVEKIDTTGPVRLIVVDDIIDGGRTFIELAAELRKVYDVAELVLFATHGIFSKGKEVLNCYDRIVVSNDMSV